MTRRYTRQRENISTQTTTPSVYRVEREYVVLQRGGEREYVGAHARALRPPLVLCAVATEDAHPLVVAAAQHHSGAT